MAVTLALSLSREAVTGLTEDVQAGVESAPTTGNPRPIRLELDVHYIESQARGEAEVELVPRSERVELTSSAKVTVAIPSAVDGALIVDILHSDGSASSTRAVAIEGQTAEYVVTGDDVERMIAGRGARPEAATPQVHRLAQLVPTGTIVPAFAKARLAVGAILGDADLGSSGAFGSFGFRPGTMSSVELSEVLAASLSSLAWTPVHIGVDGCFAAAFAQRETIGWVWWLSGARQIVGFVPDDLSKPLPRRTAVPLPALEPSPSGAATDCAQCDRAVSADVTEVELANNPAIYAEDPGSSCRPFSNPERVLSEKSFSVIARIQTPDIGAVGSKKSKSQHLLNLEALATSVADPRAAVAFRSVSPFNPNLITDAVLDAEVPQRVAEPPGLVAEYDQLPSGRGALTARRPVQWEDNIAQYQAATVALGHVLEYRVRWRSNGYSLGTVASTLTLAPRQAKRIQKISYERLERGRREETTALVDHTRDDLVRERDYDDRVAASLSEWATGESSSSSAAISAGFGFFVAPVLGAIGGGAATARSSSSQDGGRETSASEHQRLRDAIRRHGDATRRFQSTVVSEVRQEETVTGTTEVVRNANYAHSLTVIYYQILRHLKVSTEFAGARECLFIPFTIRPFTLQRAYRWRESIQKHVRTPAFGRAIKHLRDVATQFVHSDIPPGTRAQQPLGFLRGSIYVSLAVERPQDQDDGAFDALAWRGLAPFLGAPALGIWTRLKALAEASRDQAFQRDSAPTIAAKWVDKLRIKVGNTDLQADFTLATRYGFNQTVRVDFTVPAAKLVGLNREQITEVRVVAGGPLTPGSVANVTRTTLRYGGRYFDRTVEGLPGVSDLIQPETGEADAGAQAQFPLEALDYINERELITQNARELVEHLNEHVEYYHKAIWWAMDRDRLMMLLDGFYVPGSNNVSIASVVDREPLGIIGNSLVYQVGAASYIGYGEVRTRADLDNLYREDQPIVDPMLVSLPTDGLYARTIMDECLALEEHKGTLDWVLDDPDPELGFIDPSLLGSRRADVSGTLTPTSLPATIINLQNAPDAPAPSGLQGALDAISSSGSFRDMTGLAGTQANAAAALTSAAGLVTHFGSQAAAVKMADVAAKAKATQDANQQLATIAKAKNDNLISEADAARHTNQVLEQLHNPRGDAAEALTQQPEIREAIRSSDGFVAARSDTRGVQVVEIKPTEVRGYDSTRDDAAKDKAIVESIKTELALQFADPDDPGLHERRKRLRALFEGISSSGARALYERLGDSATGDSLSKTFHGRLATATRVELLWILRRKISAADATPLPVEPPPAPVHFLGKEPLPPAATERLEKAIEDLQAKLDSSSTVSMVSKQTLRCWLEKLRDPTTDDRVILWSDICPATSGAIGAAAVVGPCDLKGSRPSQTEIEQAFASAADVDDKGHSVGVFTYMRTSVVAAFEMTSRSLENLLRDLIEVNSAVNKLDDWANSQSGGSSALPEAYRALKDWLQARQGDAKSLYSCR